MAPWKCWPKVPDLGGRKVLVTRPSDQASALVREIEKANGVAVVFPALEVEGLSEQEIATVTRDLLPADIQLFVSPNAVRYGLASCNSGLLGAIGPGTANAIRDEGLQVGIVPNGGYNSEHLLDTPELTDVAGKSIRIVRGQSGRELLGSTLTHRGANVDYVQVYTRRAPSYTDSEVQRLLTDLSSGDYAAWTIMSAETLDNLLMILGETGTLALRELPLVSPASRVIIEAEERLPGILAVESDGFGPDAIVDAVDGVIVRNTGHRA